VDQELSYGLLNERANRLAPHLGRRGGGQGNLVGLCRERSPEVIVGLLGILKAGGAFVPLDPTYPDERLAFMLRDTAAPLILPHRPNASRSPARPTFCAWMRTPPSPPTTAVVAVGPRADDRSASNPPGAAHAASVTNRIGG
jgi:non-ribosomal peptide synthetase component F